MPQTRTRPPSQKSQGGKGLQKKVGGFPVWVWGAGVLAALAVGLYLRNKAKAGTSAATAQPTTDPTLSGTGASSGTALPAVADLGDHGLQNAIDAAKAQVTGLTDFINSAPLGASTATIVDPGTTGTTADTLANSTPLAPTPTPATTAANTTPTHPHTAAAAGWTQVPQSVWNAAVKGKPNTSAGRSHSPKPVEPRTHAPVTHHATHVAPKPHAPPRAPQRKPPPKKAKVVHKAGSSRVR